MVFLIFGMNMVCFYSKVDYQEDFHQRRNGISAFDHLLAVIKGQDIVNILEKGL